MAVIVGQLVLIALISYLWGSLPFGYWMGKLLRGKDFDIRQYGSHKIGATNVLRTLGKVPAVIVFILDLSKGIVPVIVAIYIPIFNGAGWGPTVAGLAALLGHRFPIFIGFQGGRSVSTGAGALLLFSPLTFLIGGITLFSTVVISRYVSLGSIVGCLTSIVCGILFFVIGKDDPAFFGKLNLAQMTYLVVAPILVILFHSDNIVRLLTGKERKIGQKETATSASTS